MKPACVLGSVTAVSLFASVASGSVLSEWNLVVLNDLVTTSEVDGSALVGGSVLGTSNYSTHLVTASNGAGLAVGGNIGAGINVQVNNGGDLRITGSVLGIANMNGGSIIADPTIPAVAAAAIAEAQGISAYLATLTANGSIDPGGNFSAVPTNYGGQMVAVYNITQAQFDAFGGVNLNFGAADSVIINFTADGSGIVDLIAPPNLTGGFANQSNSSKILWNFIGATQVKTNNTFNGALLAPDADLQVLGGGINGSVVVDSISVMNAEIRRHNYDGFIPSPGAAALFTAAGLAAVIRRRR